MAELPLVLDLAAEHVPATLLRQQLLAKLLEGEVPDVDLDAHTATFGDRTFDLQVVGTVDDAAHTFTWAWATSGIAPEAVTRCAEALRAYGAEHDVMELSEPVWHTDEVEPFLLAAIARGWCRADALYRAPVPGGAVYLLLGDVELPPPDAHQVVQALTTGIAMAPMDHRAAAMALFADAQVAVTGLDEMVVATIGTSLVNVTFTRDGRIDDVSVSHL
ncbi:DUF6882 domain-containing protein [Euzebya sp.]|uniref:DUF6882 domain-containing protein n=1 Tax=Euzebya sp. TaxID=1971409 RepID=UPI0035169A4E